MSATNSENNTDNNNNSYIPHPEDEDNEVSLKMLEESYIFKSKIRRKEKLLEKDDYEDDKGLSTNLDGISDAELRKRKMIKLVKERKK